MYDIFKMSILMVSSIMSLNLPVNENVQNLNLEKKLNQPHYEIFTRFSGHSQQLRSAAKQIIEINKHQTSETEINTDHSNLTQFTDHLNTYHVDYLTEAIDDSLNLIQETEEVVMVEEIVNTKQSNFRPTTTNNNELARPEQVKLIESPFVTPLSELNSQSVEPLQLPTPDSVQTKMTQTLDFIKEVIPEPVAECPVNTDEVLIEAQHEEEFIGNTEEILTEQQPEVSNGDAELEALAKDPLMIEQISPVSYDFEASSITQTAEEIDVYEDFRQTYYSVEHGEVKVGYGVTYDSDQVKNIDNVMHYYDNEYEWLPIVAMNIDEVLDTGFDDRGVPVYYGTIIEITYPGGDIMKAIVLDACGACSRDNRIDLWVYSPNIVHDVSGIQYRIIREGFKDEDTTGSTEFTSEVNTTN